MMKADTDDTGSIVTAAEPGVCNPAMELESLRREVEYYRRQLDELAGENLRQTYLSSGHVWKLRQKRQGFVALAQLQSAIRLDTSWDLLLDKAVYAITTTLNMDCSVALTPMEGPGCWKIASRLGLPGSASASVVHLPPDFAGINDAILVNSSSPDTHLSEWVRTTLGVPYFIALPIIENSQLICMLITGRLVESRPFRPPLDDGDVDILSAIARLIETWALNQRIVTLRERLVREELERQAMMERERGRIARDMHDEIGGSLTRIAILSELVQSSNSPTVGDHLRMISTIAGDMVDVIGEIIWALNPRNDSLGNLCAYLREYIGSYFEATPICCTIDFPDDIPDSEVSAEARRNLYLVIKEAAHNTLKYSGADEVKLRLHIGNEHLEFLLEDNGGGFDIEHVRRFGNGLENMRKRMEDIGGECRIASSPGTGTMISALLPLPPTFM